MEYLDKKIQKYIYIAVFILYIFLVFIVGYNHEPWADEAQSWLIARDNGFWAIFQETKYEGHPFIWFFIVKIFIKTFSVFMDSVKLYNWIFILPLISTSIGVYLLLFKSKFPALVKIACPFTYYIFYQCGIIARNHCLCFPMLAIIAVFYHKRLEHPFLYILLLILNANICAYLYPISIVLLIFFFIDYYKNKNELNIKKYHLSLLTGMLFLGLTAIHMYNPSDCYFWEGINYGWDIFHRTLTLIASIYYPAHYFGISTMISLVMTALLFITLMKLYCRNFYQAALFLSLNIPLYIVYNFIYIQYWHYQYSFIILLFTCWILTDINNIDHIPFKKNILLYVLTLFTFGYYIISNVVISYYDFKNDYSGSKRAAAFIKKYNLQDYEIIGLGMKSVGLQPYFDKNLYSNYIGSTHFSWHNEFFQKYNENKNKITPIIVLVDYDTFIDYDSEYNNFLNDIQDDYDIYYYKGEMRGLNYKKGNRELNSYIIYVDKNLSNTLNINENHE